MFSVSFRPLIHCFMTSIKMNFLARRLITRLYLLWTDRNQQEVEVRPSSAICRIPFSPISPCNPTLYNANKHRQCYIIYMRRWEHYVTPESFTVLTKPSELAFPFIQTLSLPLFLKLLQSDLYTPRYKKSLSLTRGWNHKLCCYFILMYLFLILKGKFPLKSFIRRH